MDDRALQGTEYRIVSLVGHEYRTHRHQSAAERFRQYDHVGLHAVVMGGKEFAGAGKPGLHFVEDEQGPMFPAQVFRGLQIISVRNANSGFTLKRLQHERSVAPGFQSRIEGCQIAERNLIAAGKQWSETLLPEVIAHE